jgi:hypothetical protein
MAILKGNNQHNNLVGSITDDAIYGYGGDDVLIGDAGDDVLKGASGADILIGGDGNDVLNGGEGTDILIGGAGDDLYVVDSNEDAITELADAGVDMVRSSVTWVLGDHLENLVLTGTGAINALGNTLDNKLKGNGSDNLMDGGEGDDVLNGGLGVDNLMGGTGNDSLKVDDLNGDEIDGGEGMDNLQIGADNQILDLRNAPNLRSIETIRLADSHSTLMVDAVSVIALSDTDTLKVDASDGGNTLKIDGGWTDAGLVDGYHIFTKGDATLQVNPIITDIRLPDTYTISDAATAAHVGAIFDDKVQEITIDFGGKSYGSWGLSTIDLSGFGAEDKLLIAQRDGLVDSSFYDQPSQLAEGDYFIETSQYYGYLSGHYYRDSVSWQQGANEAYLKSFGSSYTSFGTTPTTTGGLSAPAISAGYWVNQFSVQLTGLPGGSADSGVVFV